jgi:hypothetical protein
MCTTMHWQLSSYFPVNTPLNTDEGISLRKLRFSNRPRFLGTTCPWFFYGMSATFAPFKLWKMSLRSSIHSCSSSLFSSVANSLKMFTRMYSHSVYTSLEAGQILGPPEKGVYSQVGLIVSHRSGLNWSASSPQKDLSRCWERKLVSIKSPFSTNNGLRPSLPPPAGMTVVERHSRTVPALRGVIR